MARLRRGDIVVLDTRPANEYAAGHIAGAISVPVDEFKSRLRGLPKHKEYVAYCRGPYCVYADRAVELLREERTPRASPARRTSRNGERLVCPMRALSLHVGRRQHDDFSALLPLRTRLRRRTSSAVARSAVRSRRHRAKTMSTRDAPSRHPRTCGSRTSSTRTCMLIIAPAASRSRGQTGAAYCLHESADVVVPFTPIEDGEEIELGNTRVRVMHTPGHSPESVSPRSSRT